MDRAGRAGPTEPTELTHKAAGRYIAPMTEDEARQVLLLQARESGADLGAAPSALWTAEDRAWATRQAVSAVGEQATPEQLVMARTALALQRLLPKDAAAKIGRAHV